MSKNILLNVIKNLCKHMVEIRTTDRGWEEGSFFEYREYKLAAMNLEAYIGRTEMHEMLYA